MPWLVLAVPVLLVMVTVLWRHVPVCSYPAIFFVLKFVGARFLDFERVRYATMFQIVVIAFLFVAAVLKSDWPRRSETPFQRAVATIGTTLICADGVFVCLGVLFGNAISQAVIDSYKLLEILILYYLFKVSWRCLPDVKRGLSCLYVVMTACGIMELFLTERGGVGLALCISLVPIFCMTYGTEDPKKKGGGLFLILLVSLVVVFACQTRTYILAFVLGLVLLLLISGPRKRFQLLISLVTLVALFVVFVSVTGVDVFSSTLERFEELGNGFEEAGGFRAAELKVLIAKFSERPMLGWGLGYLERQLIEGMGAIEWGSFVHNAYAELLLKVGLLGFSILMLLLSALISTLAKTYRSASNYLQGLIKGSLVALCSWAVIFFTAPPSSFGSMFVGIIIAIVAVSVSYPAEAAAHDSGLVK